VGANPFVARELAPAGLRSRPKSGTGFFQKACGYRFSDRFAAEREQALLPQLFSGAFE
jgi:hypothetical protein